MSNKPRLTDTEKKALLRVFVGRFGLVPLVTLALRAIGAQKVGLLLQFKDPGLTDEDVERLLAAMAKVTTTKEVVTLATAAIGIARVNEILAYLAGRGLDEVGVIVPPVANRQYPTDPTRLVGIGRDYTWTKNPEDRDRFYDSLARWGLNVTSIEYGGWGQAPGPLYLYRDGNAKIAAQYKLEVAAARRTKTLLFVNVVNDNKGSGKYGDDRKYLDSYKAQVEAAMNTVLAEGPEGVWVQIVGEGGISKRPYAAELIKKWTPIFRQAGFKTVNNTPARSSSKGLADFYAWHNCQLSDFGPDGCILVTDCGTAIASYTEGGLNGKRLKPSTLESYTRNVVAKGGRGHIIYTGWYLETVSDEDIAAVARGAGLVGGGKPVPVPPPVSDAADAIDISRVFEASTGNLMDEQKVPITHTLKNLRRSGNKITFTNDFPSTFFRKTKGDPVTDLARFYCYWVQDGRAYGGHFDWCRTSTKDRELKNVFSSYFRINPPKDALLYFSVVASDGKTRTNVARPV